MKRCTKCITEPEVFFKAIMPLSECRKYGWHVHKNGNGYAIYKDDLERINDLPKIKKI